MTARTCAAILLACVIHCGDGGSRWTSGSDAVDKTIQAGVQVEPHADRTLAVRRLVQRAVWVDDTSDLAARPAGVCIETFDVCTDCARSVAVIDGLEGCARARDLIAF